MSHLANSSGIPLASFDESTLMVTHPDRVLSLRMTQQQELSNLIGHVREHAAMPHPLPERLPRRHDVDELLAGGIPPQLLADEGRQGTARGRKASVAPPTCGEMSMLGADHSGWSAGNGSGSVTSAAARSRPEFSSARRHQCRQRGRE